MIEILPRPINATFQHAVGVKPPARLHHAAHHTLVALIVEADVSCCGGFGIRQRLCERNRSGDLLVNVAAAEIGAHLAAQRVLQR